MTGFQKLNFGKSLKKSFKKAFLLLFIGFFGFSCNPPTDSVPLPAPPEEEDSVRVLLTETERERAEELRDNNSSRSRSRCSSRDRNSRNLSIKDSRDNFISSNNIAEYELSGRCEINDQAVVISVNGYRISKNPKCDKRRWKVEMDLSSITQFDDNIVFKVSHNDNTVCKEIRVAFEGPKNYIPVPALEDYFESSFYVMKYEAKIENYGTNRAKAVSKPEGKPFTKASYTEALKLCENNGAGYSLMENSQWQNIALSIEDNNINWSNGRKYISDDNALNCGVTSGFREASDNDLDDCYGTSCDPDWDFNRRTHILSNGQTIWDMCGNAPEMMKDLYRENTDFTGYIYELSSKLKDLFGPERDYEFSNESRRSRNWGLGYADISADKNLIVRGVARRNPGLFSVTVSQNQEDRSSGRGLGFRCVYIP